MVRRSVRHAVCLIASGWAVTAVSSPSGADDPSGTVWRSFRAGRAEAVNLNLAAPAHSLVGGVAQVSAAVLGSGYARWAGEVFNAVELADPRVSAPEAVGPDGVSNLMRYALGLDARTDATEWLPEAGQCGEHWFLWYRRPSDTSDVAYRVEVSTDGENWTSEGVTQEPILLNDFAESWQAHYQAAGARAVEIRLVVVICR